MPGYNVPGLRGIWLGVAFVLTTVSAALAGGPTPYRLDWWLEAAAGSRSMSPVTIPMTTEADEIFSDGFESGDFSAWLGPGPSLTVTTDRSVLVPNQMTRLTAEVLGPSDPSVDWYVNGVAGGDATVGTVSTDGLYLAPGAVPSPDRVTVEAVSVADPDLSAAVEVTIQIPSSSLYPRPGADTVLRVPPPLEQVPIPAGAGGVVAVLDWTDRDPGGSELDVLSVCHAFAPFAIPHVHPPDLEAASAYPFVAVAGALDGLSVAERNGLLAYASDGGTLLLWEPADADLLSDLGIGPSVSISGQVDRPLTFDTSTGDSALEYIDHPAEVDWPFRIHELASTRSYAAPVSGQVLARWDADDKPAMVRVDVGTGRVYVFGWRLKRTLAWGELHLDEAGADWTNTPVLGTDICKLLVRGVYEGWAGEDARIRDFAPEGKEAALILTHDVGFDYSDVPYYLTLEGSWGVRATYFFTTTAFDTGWIRQIYDPSSREFIQQALDAGHHVGSHSFSHFPDFYWSIPLGETATAESYLPQYSWYVDETYGISIVGELGVSRWLLEQDFGITVESFRSGYLLRPFDFEQGLTLTGYRRDTSFAGGPTRGAFPFRLWDDDELGNVAAFPVLEYPMTLDDTGLDETLIVVDAWEEVLRANYANNAPTVLLVHPTPDLEGVDAIHELLSRIGDLELWVGDLKSFGEHWEGQGTTCSRWP